MAKLNTGTSIVDFLKSQGKDSSYSARKSIATKMGITNYSGSEEQNIQMLNTLKKSDATKSNNTPKVETPKADVPKVVNNDVVEKKEEPKNPILGVDSDKYNDAFNNSFVESDASKNATGKVNQNLSNLESLVGKDDIISRDVMQALGSQFVVPEAVKEADAWLSSQLEKIQSGKTSYSDQVQDVLNQIMNKEKFSYDVDQDPLFQQALASAMNSGNQAMQDTIGQASALTGGYGSTYATTAGNQAYNAFIEDAYDNLPQYYNMARESYQMDVDNMYRQFGMLSELDDKEYNRNLSAYDATYSHRNQMYNESYNLFRDNKNDAFAMANLQLNEHGQRVSDATNLYNATSDFADKVYEREYNSWLDSVNMAMKEAEFLNSDAWATKNFDESIRQYEKNYAQTEDHFTRNQEFQSAESQKQREWQSAESQKDRDFTASENAKSRAASVSRGGVSTKQLSDSIPTNIEKQAKEAKNDEARLNYVSDMVDKGYITQEQGAYLMDTYNQGALNDRVWELESKGGLNWGGGIDKNGKVKDQYDNSYTLGDLWDEASKTMGKGEAEKWIMKLQKDLGITWW